jgi:hypothetical protein
MRMNAAIAHSGSIANAVLEGVLPIGNFAAVCIFSLAGLILTALCLALVGFEEATQVVAAAFNI